MKLAREGKLRQIVLRIKQNLVNRLWSLIKDSFWPASTSRLDEGTIESADLDPVPKPERYMSFDGSRGFWVEVEKYHDAVEGWKNVDVTTRSMRTRRTLNADKETWSCFEWCNFKQAWFRTEKIPDSNGGLVWTQVHTV